MTETRPAVSGLPDPDAEETREWLDSLDGPVDVGGPHRARRLMLRLVERAGERRGDLPPGVAGEAACRYRVDDAGYFPVGVSAGGES